MMTTHYDTTRYLETSREKEVARVLHNTRISAQQKCEAAIGKQLRVRTGPNSLVFGEIVRAEIGNPRVNQCSAGWSFKVWLAAKNGAVNGPFTVNAVPVR